jgi:hypothetical protein
MLITFHSKAHSPITMHAEPALELLSMMGLEAKTPGGLYADDVPQALWQLQQALSDLATVEPQQVAAVEPDESDEPPKVSLNTRAMPLLELLRRAVKQQHPVHWD